MRNERYYYSVMLPEEKKAYRMIFDGLKARGFHIPVSVCLARYQVQEIYLRVLYDNPLFFYVNQRVIRMTGESGSYTLMPEYLYSEREITALTQEIKHVVAKVAAGASQMPNEFRLEKYLHDSVVKSVAYDYESLSKSDCFNAHSIIGCFLDRKAVCEGIAKAFKLLCNEFSMKCIVVLGKASPDGDFSGDCYHAWNLVKIGNESYHVDPTWDNLYDREIRHISYDYFNVTTEEILKDHRPLEGQLPFCSSTRLNYFYSTRSIVSTYSQLLELVRERFDRKEIMFKTVPDANVFLNAEDLKKKTYDAVIQVMGERGISKPFALLFNEIHSIGKIIFVSAP